MCVRCGELVNVKHSQHSINFIDSCTYCHERAVIDFQTLADFVNNLYLLETDGDETFDHWMKRKNIEY